MSRAPRNAYDGHRDAQASSSKSARLSGGLDAEPNPTPDEIKQRQNEAAEILNDWERLAMRAVANNEVSESRPHQMKTYHWPATGPVIAQLAATKLVLVEELS